VLALTARAIENRTLARLVGAAGLLFVLGLGASLVVFVLDALQLKTIVSTQMTPQFNTTTARVGAVTALFILANLILTVSAFAKIGTPARKAASGGSTRSRAADSTNESESDSDVLIVGVRDN
jgi:hypothetical protein